MKEQKKNPKKTTKAKAVKPEAAGATADQYEVVDVRKIVQDIVRDEFDYLEEIRKVTTEIRDTMKEIVELLRNNDKKLPNLGYDWTRTPAPPPRYPVWPDYDPRTQPWPHDPWGGPVPYAGPGNTSGDEPPKPDRRIWVDGALPNHTCVRQ